MPAAEGTGPDDGGLGHSSIGDNGAPAGRAWLAGLPGELAAQRRAMAGLIEFCEVTTLVTSLSVGCSLGRGAADALSDIDAALGIDAECGDAGGGQVEAVEVKVVAALPGLGPLVDVLQHRVGPGGRLIRRMFAQFNDGTQLDLVGPGLRGHRRAGPRVGVPVAGLDPADLRQAARACAMVLTRVSASAAQRHPADLPSAMAGYVTRALSRDR